MIDRLEAEVVEVAAERPEHLKEVSAAKEPRQRSREGRLRLEVEGGEASRWSDVDAQSPDFRQHAVGQRQQFQRVQRRRVDGLLHLPFATAAFRQSEVPSVVSHVGNQAAADGQRLGLQR